MPSLLDYGRWNRMGRCCLEGLRHDDLAEQEIHFEESMKKIERSKLGKKARRPGLLRATRGWIAMGTLAAYAVMGGTRSALAAVEKVAPTGAGVPEANLPLKRFDIAAGPLDGAIEAYERATGLTVKVVLPAGDGGRVQLAGREGAVSG